MARLAAVDPANPEPMSIGLGAIRSRAQQEPQGWLVDGLVHRSGITLVYAGAETGKTRFLSAMSVAVASGKPFLGRETLQGGVYWLYLEHVLSSFVKDLDQAHRGFGLAPDDSLPIAMLASRRWKYADARIHSMVMAEIERFEPALVVVDSLRRTGDHSDNNPEEVAVLMQGLADLTGQGKRQVIGIHHNVKGSLVLRGTEEYIAGSDSQIGLSHPVYGTFVANNELRVLAKHHGAPESKHRLRIDQDEHVLRYSEMDAPPERQPKKSTAKVGSNTLQAIITATVKQNPGLTISRLTAACKSEGAKGSAALINAEIKRLCRIDSSGGQARLCYPIE